MRFFRKCVIKSLARSDTHTNTLCKFISPYTLLSAHMLIILETSRICAVLPAGAAVMARGATPATAAAVLVGDVSSVHRTQSHFRLPPSPHWCPDRLPAGRTDCLLGGKHHVTTHSRQPLVWIWQGNELLTLTFSLCGCRPFISHPCLRCLVQTCLPQACLWKVPCPASKPSANRPAHRDICERLIVKAEVIVWITGIGQRTLEHVQILTENRFPPTLREEQLYTRLTLQQTRPHCINPP